LIDLSSRLITSGCSYTEYAWPTWATYLGKHFQNHVNVGRSGSDNAGIARRVIDIVQPNDVVVILWSGYDRWNSYSDNPVPNPIDKENNHWVRKGCMNVRHKQYYADHYHKVERFYSTMDYIQLINLHSKLHGYSAYHFSAFPFFMGETETQIDSQIQEIYNKFKIENNFLTENDMESLKLFLGNDPANWHPSPFTHWSFLEKYMSNKLDIVIDRKHYSDDDQTTANLLAPNLH
jgi:hypothetical protein